MRYYIWRKTAYHDHPTPCGSYDTLAEAIARAAFLIDNNRFYAALGAHDDDIWIDPDPIDHSRRHKRAITPDNAVAREILADFRAALPHPLAKLVDAA